MTARTSKSKKSHRRRFNRAQEAIQTGCRDCDALVEWLQPCLPLKGKIVDAAKFRDNLQLLKVAVEITEWPHNGLRHSFGSYHLALHGDAIKSANQMGHRDSVIVHNHYKALVLKTEAEKFWGLRPKQTTALTAVNS